MFTQLRLHGFKNFEDSTLKLGPLTLIVGANAAGKSNLRDAFRFVHGVGRRYSVAEIIGEKWSAGGVQVWSGMRGGLREVATSGRDKFSIGADLDMHLQLPVGVGGFFTVRSYRYNLEISTDRRRPRVTGEGLNFTIMRDWQPVFERHSQHDRDHIKFTLRRYGKSGRYPPSRTYITTTPAITHIVEDGTVDKRITTHCRWVLNEFGSCRFLDLNPEAMRQPSIPGQTTLGDRGDNLSSVLQAICADKSKKAALLDWVRQLTPMDAVDFDFPDDQTGRVLLTFVESDGRRTSAYSASDGTLRLLAILAALLGPDPARFYFLEELENGIHPNRLALLVQLLETTTAQGKTQVVATTHSPQLLRLLSRKSLEHASVVYRLPGTSAGRIKRIVDIPYIREVLTTQDLARLHESGWLEDVLSFSEAPEPDAEMAEA